MMVKSSVPVRFYTDLLAQHAGILTGTIRHSMPLILHFPVFRFILSNIKAPSLFLDCDMSPRTQFADC